MTLSPWRFADTAIVAVAAGVLHAMLGQAHYLYRGRYRYGSFEEVKALTSTVLCTAALILFADVTLFLRRPVPASAPIVGGLLALVVMFGGRYLLRRVHDLTLRPDRRDAAPVLLFGAGSAAHALVAAMMRDPRGKYLPVGLLDDDPGKRHLRVDGVPVLGGRDAIGRAVTATRAGTVIFAVANSDAGLVRDVRTKVLEAGARFKMVPSVSELLDAPISVAHVRDVQVTDLLGRHQIETDLDSIAGYLTGKRVLITGAGGSIGSELCRQVHRFRPAELIMLDRDESALHAVQLSLSGQALLDTPDLVLTDLRDARAVRAVFEQRKPQVVFHAAALKHLTLLERHPGEAVKTNILGTLNVLEAAADVERFVNISTDKAANPTSVLGYSKRITERLTAHAGGTLPGTFLNVRFGNVLGSRGSVLTAFSAQVAAGGPVTVTHPDVTRYFMTVQEAVQLVIQAAAIGRDGEALVLQMGEPVRIAQVAQQMADLGPMPVEIVYTGLRPGEKLHEELFGAGERDVRPLHPLISHVEVPPLDPAPARALDADDDPGMLTTAMRHLCDTGVRAEPTAVGTSGTPLGELSAEAAELLGLRARPVPGNVPQPVRS
nr:nucleoside-diphosphate sugar epimerase/dehydratase [Virgisporangium aliadipatigenens]